MGISERTSSRTRIAPHRILLIDNDAEIAGALGSALCAEGYHVRSTTHGADLLRLVSLVEPDVLVTDVIMEDVDTLEVMATLRQSHPDMKIIAISGNAHLLTLASKCGANHVLAKPFRLQRLSLLVKIAVQ
jgi:DNA-binding NtrC family response regulator